MEWNEDALILGTRKHGETSVILEVMTRDHGRHLGLVRGGRSRKMQPMLQPGNKVHVNWRARLEDHLGVFSVDPLELRAAMLIETKLGLYGIQTIASLLRLLPERDPHGELADAADIMIENLTDAAVTGALLVRFELAVLEELGFGLDLSKCAATERRDDLVYVSPKSGRAVSADAGKPYHDRMLSLPSFVVGEGIDLKPEDLKAGFDLTEFFLSRHIYQPRGITPPIARQSLQAEIQRLLQAE